MEVTMHFRDFKGTGVVRYRESVPAPYRTVTMFTLIKEGST
jgi:hypothetical protein